MPLTSVTYTFDFTAGDLGFLATLGHPGVDPVDPSFAWYSASAAIGVYGTVPGSPREGVSTIYKDGFSWLDFGVPHGKYVRYVDFTVTGKHEFPTFACRFQPGISGQKGESVPFSSAVENFVTVFQEVSFPCALFPVQTAFQHSDSFPMRLTIGTSGGAYNWHNFIRYFTVICWYDDTPLDTAGDIVFTPPFVTLPPAGSQAFTLTPRPLNFSIDPGSGSIDNTGPSQLVTYTAPGTSGDFFIHWHDPYESCLLGDVHIQVVGPSGAHTLITEEAIETAFLPPLSDTPGVDLGRKRTALYPVAAFNQTPYLLFARPERNQIAALDLYTPAAKGHVIWHTVPIDGGEAMRLRRKRFRRMRVYGEGTLDPVDAGTVTFIADGGMYIQTFPVYAYLSDPTQDILILQETGTNLIGRQVEVRLDLSGTGLTLREVQLEYVVLT